MSWSGKRFTQKSMKIDPFPTKSMNYHPFVANLKGICWLFFVVFVQKHMFISKNFPTYPCNIPQFHRSGGRLCTRILGSQVHADGSAPKSQVHAEVWCPGSQVHAGSCWRALCGAALFCPWALPLLCCWVQPLFASGRHARAPLCVLQFLAVAHMAWGLGVLC